MTPNGTLPRHEKKVAPKAIWDALISNRVPAGASKMIAVSGVEVGQMRRAGISQERIAQIPNGLTLEEFSNLPQKGTFRNKHKIVGPIVAYLGQISPRKGVSHLVEAFRDHDMMGATLVVAGNDMGAMAHAKSVASKVSGERVIFTGLLEGADRLALLVDADVLVYPSTDEIFGLVPFEGLLCGAPVVVGGDCGCGQLIQQAGAGLLVRHSDVVGLRDRILTLLGDRVAAEAMVNRGKDYINSNLGFAKIAQDHIALYNAVIDHHRIEGRI
jgi:glycosyltransferase involved in cell wall biosynthesis